LSEYFHNSLCSTSRSTKPFEDDESSSISLGLWPEKLCICSIMSLSAARKTIPKLNSGPLVHTSIGCRKLSLKNNQRRQGTHRGENICRLRNQYQRARKVRKAEETKMRARPQNKLACAAEMCFSLAILNLIRNKGCMIYIRTRRKRRQSESK
jgi:hypothetical protein